MVRYSEYAQATWFTNPNHDLAPVMSTRTETSLMALRIVAGGAGPGVVIENPVNLSPQQNLNLEAFTTVVCSKS